jgi:hypothetical protein
LSLKSRVVFFGFMLMASLVSIRLLVPLLILGQWRPDFTPLWAGARSLNPYDIWTVTRLQAFMFDASKPLPFLYPPSSLPIFYPFGLLPFPVSYALWTVLSLGVFWSAARQVTDRPWLTFLAPPVVYSVYIGQTALVTGAAIIFAVAELPKRPLLAGTLFGLAASLKPQAALLAPFAMVVGRHWKALAAASGTWLFLAASTANLWLDWWQVIRVFPAILNRYYPYIWSYGATPSIFAKALGSPPEPFVVAGIASGLVIVWKSFRSNDTQTRIIGLATGTLLTLPYAMAYDISVMVPAYIGRLRKDPLKGAIIALPMLLTSVLAVVPALVASALILIRSSNSQRVTIAP